MWWRNDRTVFRISPLRDRGEEAKELKSKNQCARYSTRCVTRICPFHCTALDSSTISNGIVSVCCFSVDTVALCLPLGICKLRTEEHNVNMSVDVCIYFTFKYWRYKSKAGGCVRVCSMLSLSLSMLKRISVDVVCVRMFKCSCNLWIMLFYGHRHHHHYNPSMSLGFAHGLWHFA